MTRGNEMRMTQADLEPSLGLMPEVDVRPLLAGRTRLTILRPSYAALGLGTLRVLRIRERLGHTEVVAGYDGYERLPAGPSNSR